MELVKIKQRRKLGKLPGTSTYTGDIQDQVITIELIKYFKDDKDLIYQDITLDNIPAIAAYFEDDTVTWINVQGVHSVEVIKELANILNFHALLVEDLLNTRQRPKLDQYKHHIAIFLRHSLNIPDTVEFENEQVVIIIGKNYVISLTETDIDVFKPIKEALEIHKLHFKKYQNDYLGYTLMDFIIDTYMVEAEEIETRIEALEERIFTGDLDNISDTIFKIRRQNLNFRKIVLPLRELSYSLNKLDSEFLGSALRLFLKDLTDHIFVVLDSVETNRDLISNLRENYNSELSNRMNQVMMTLTVMSTILLPLTFLTGLYGMNFANIPELNYKNGYFFLWGLMIVIASSLLYYFRKKKWI